MMAQVWEDLLWEWPEVNNSTADDEGGVDSYAIGGPLMMTDPPTTTSSSSMPPINTLTDGQEILLNSLQIASALLSLGGSCIILYKILRGLYKNQTTTPYDRIILGLSSCDIVASLMHMASPFLLPRDTSVRVWAVGSDRTCSVLGFLTQVAAFWAVWYNCVLSFYYLLTVRFKVKRQALYRKYELWMHLSGGVFFPTTALIGHFGNFFAEQALTISCWVRTVGSIDDYSAKNQTYTEIAAYVFASPIMVTFIAIIVNNIIIYRHVRKTLLVSPPQKLPSSATAADIESASDSGRASRSNSITSRSSEISIQEKLAREAAIQCFLYVFCFLLTCSPVVILQIMDGSLGYDIDDKATIYPLLVLNSLLVPLQGFFNVFIYVRPSYGRFATAHPDKPMWKIVKLALLESNIPRMSSVAPHMSSNNMHHNIEKHKRYSSGSGSGGGGLGGDKNSPFAMAIARKHSQMRSIGGSNFESSLRNIVEEENSDSDDNNSSSSEHKETRQNTISGSPRLLVGGRKNPSS